MAKTFEDILRLIQDGEIVVSSHGYDELVEDSLTVHEIISGASNAVVVEDYPFTRKALAFWFCNRMRTENPFMLFGAFPKADILRPC
jgi:hypothetical protein